MIPLPLYAKIKDRYCIGYFGDSDNVIRQLKKARPLIEKELPGIQVYICCNDEKVNILKNEDRVVPRSTLEVVAKEVAYFREMVNETVTDLLDESRIPYDKNEFSCIDNGTVTEKPTGDTNECI